MRRKRQIESFICLSLIAVAAIVLPYKFANAQGQTSLLSQQNFQAERDRWMKQSNNGTVRIVTKGLGCTCTNFASDMAHVLNDFGKIRVLPVLGTGSIQGVVDVLYLKGIDLSILQSDVLAYIKRNKIHANIEQRLRYVTKLHHSELHLIASKDIKDIKDLDGKVVSYDAKGRGSFITAQNVFDSLGIKVRPVRIERDVSIEKIKSGEISAAFVVTGKPANSMRKIKAEHGIHFLAVPFTKPLYNTYFPTKLTHKDYPDLIPEGESVPTIAVSEVLAVYNWKKDTYRYRKISTFIDNFFDNFDEFMKPVRHPKWKQVNLSAKVPGWIRFGPAEEKLRTMIAHKKNLQLHFFEFLKKYPQGERLSELDKQKLLNDYREWSKNKR